MTREHFTADIWITLEVMEVMTSNYQVFVYISYTVKFQHHDN